MTIRILAVGDPAVYAYTDSSLGLLGRCERDTGHSVRFDILPWAEYGERVFAEAASAEPAYDVVMVAGHLWLPQFVTAGWLAPLDTAGPLHSADYAPDDVLPGVAAEMRYADTQYLAPSFSDGHILYAHGSLDGLTDETGRGDVARFAGSGRSSVVKKAPSEIFLDWLPYLRRFGGAFLDEQGEPAFNGPAGREAAEAYRELSRRVDAAFAPYGNEEVASAIRDGAVSFGVSWGGQAGQIVTTESRKTLEYVTLSDPWNVTWSFGVLAASPHRSAATEVLAVLTDAAADRAVGEYAGSPCRASSYRDPELRARCPWFPAQEDLLRTARPLPSRPDLPQLLGPISAALTDIVDGDTDIAGALDAAAAAIRETGHA